MQLPSRRLVVLGGTSAYEVCDSENYPPPWIDEATPIDFNKPRVIGEEYLRKDCGAIVLRVAGIYGPGLIPLDWIRSGRVGPSRKYVNLIHVEDLAVICLTALERGKPGEVYNVSDGTPRTWEEICQMVAHGSDVVSLGSKDRQEPGKRISNGKLVRDLRPHLSHPELSDALVQLNRK
jgi:nucleoside-diphosphate-sugar epimerase